MPEGQVVGFHACEVVVSLFCMAFGRKSIVLLLMYYPVH